MVFLYDLLVKKRRLILFWLSNFLLVFQYCLWGFGKTCDLSISNCKYKSLVRSNFVVKELIMQSYQQAIYTQSAIYELEQSWFAGGNSPFGLMMQAGWGLAIKIDKLLKAQASTAKILIWCGVGNNGGDGYLVGCYLANFGYDVAIFAPNPPKSDNAKLAHAEAVRANLDIHAVWQETWTGANVHIDAIFGVGLAGELGQDDRVVIDKFNAQQGLKIAIDIPSGLLADIAMPSPVAVQAHHTMTVIGLKLGLVMGQGRYLAGKVSLLPLIPPNHAVAPIAYLSAVPTLPKRPHHAHKGDFGFVTVIGGHKTMGGAVILSALSAMAVGAGRVSVACHPCHHGAILANNPAVMTADSQMAEDGWQRFLADKDVICLGMGLGRDEEARQIFVKVLEVSRQLGKPVILDADGLYWLAQTTQKLSNDWIATPHSAEAARLLGVSCDEVNKDKLSAIIALQNRYGGNWVLKGAGTLTIEQEQIHVCPFGNAGMATAGMGDVLSGVIAGLIGQGVSLAECVAIHAKAGDRLAKRGERGLSAYEMMDELRAVVNGLID